MTAAKAILDDYDYMRPIETIYFDVDRCIYCGCKNGLDKEHIVPYWMMGGYVIRNASCKVCATITSRFENELSNTSFAVLRRRMRFQSRSSKKERKNNAPPPLFELIVNEAGDESVKFVQAHQLPAVVVSLQYPPAGILEGRAPLPALRPRDLPVRITFMNITGMVPKRKEILYGKFKIPFNPTSYMRLAAKIAHGFFSVAKEFSDFKPLLNGAILTGHYVSYFVGMPVERPDVDKSGHMVTLSVRTIPPDSYYEYAVATINLFCEFGGPCFEVVTGRRRIEGLGGDSSSEKYLPEIYGSEGKFESCIILSTASASAPVAINQGTSA
ncbi:hypothetical protein ACEN9F_13305 [Duganella sp. CT11-25]|uniref:hypothetical protein n=1 Tax=unclassified Duganella TaxID=2636909 RepID=UPI0039AF4D9E